MGTPVNVLKANMVNAIHEETLKGNITWNPHVNNGIEYMVAKTDTIILEARKASVDYPMVLYVRFLNNLAREQYSVKDVEDVYIINPIKALISYLFNTRYKSNTERNMTYREYTAFLSNQDET